MPVWYYSRNGASQQEGPVTAEALKGMAAAGQLRPTDQVWKDGLPSWVEASQIRGLFPSTAAVAIAAPVVSHSGHLASTAPVARAPMSQATPAHAATLTAQPVAALGYHVAGGDAPPAYLEALNRFASANGPRGDWPLSPDHMATLRDSGTLRKTIRNLAICFRIMAFFYLLAAALYGTIFAYAFMSLGGGRRGIGSGMLEPLLIVVGVPAGLAILNFICAGGTRKCGLWGPIVMLVVNGILALGSLGYALYTYYQLSQWESMATTFPSRLSYRSSDAMGYQVVWITIATAVFYGGISVWCIRAISAIPRFLSRPAWSVALISQASA